MKRIVLVSGSLRAGSTNAAALLTAQKLAPPALEAAVYQGLADLPHFNPDHDKAPLHPAVSDLRNQLAQADAVLFSTPEYAGALPGSFKNLLDWTVGGGQLYQKPVGWLNVSSPASPSGAADAHDSLRKVLGYTGSLIVEAACVRIPVVREMMNAEGMIADLEVQKKIEVALEVLLEAILQSPHITVK